MYKRTIILLILTLLIVTIHAEDNNEKKNYNFALLYGIEDFTKLLNPLEGSILSFKYNLNEKNAFRFGVSTKFNYYLTEPDLVAGAGYNTVYDDTVANSTLYISYLRYFGGDLFKPYFGFGIHGIYKLNKRVRKEYDDEFIEGTYTQEQHGFGGGCLALLGIQWNPIKQFGLFAEYGIKFSYIYQESILTNEYYSPDRKTVESTIGHLFEIDPLVTRLGAAFYF